MGVMGTMGFGSRWIGWIRNGVLKQQITVLVNGSIAGEFDMERGLRQGDPLSPLLFLLVVEGLNRLFSQAVDLDLFTGILVGSPPMQIPLL